MEQEWPLFLGWEWALCCSFLGAVVCRSFSMLGLPFRVGLALLPWGWRLAFSPWSRCWPFLLPSQIGLALPLRDWGSSFLACPFLLGWEVWPFFFGVGLTLPSVLWLALPSRDLPSLLGVWVCPSLLGVWVCPSLLGVLVCPSLLGVLVCPSLVGVFVCPSLLGVEVAPFLIEVWVGHFFSGLGGPSLSWCGLALSSWISGWHIVWDGSGPFIVPSLELQWAVPFCVGLFSLEQGLALPCFLLRVGLVFPSWSDGFLVVWEVGPSSCGQGRRFFGWPSLSGFCWQFLLVIGVRPSYTFHFVVGVGPSCPGLAFGPSFLKWGWHFPPVLVLGFFFLALGWPFLGLQQGVVTSARWPRDVGEANDGRCADERRRWAVTLTRQ